MKLRIKGNSLRIRLTKSEVNTLAEAGYLQEQTSFPNKPLIYALQTKPDANALTVTFLENKITMFVPQEFAKHWPANNVVGLDAVMSLPNNEALNLLLEKDFVCLDATTEDQSDHFENPNKTC